MKKEERKTNERICDPGKDVPEKPPSPGSGEKKRLGNEPGNPYPGIW